VQSKLTTQNSQGDRARDGENNLRDTGPRRIREERSLLTGAKTRETVGDEASRKFCWLSSGLSTGRRTANEVGKASVGMLRGKMGTMNKGKDGAMLGKKT